MNDDAGERIHHLRSLTNALPPPASHPRYSGLTDVSADRSSDIGDAPGANSAAISKAIVGLLRTCTGRGPTRARTSISSGLAIVTLGDCLTAAEKALVAGGHDWQAMQVRRTLHEGIRAEAVAAVETITGRNVVAYLTDQHLDPDLAVIVFVFGPSPWGGS